MKSIVRALVATLLLVLGQTGCRHIGPDVIVADRLPSNEAIAASKIQPPGNHYQSARAAFTDGNMAQADLEVKLALQENPLDAQAHFLFACLLEQKRETDQAIVGFQRVAAIEPTNPVALYNLGTMLLRRGEAVAAAQLFEKAILLRPDHVPTYNNLAKAYFLADLPELAMATYEEALRRDSSNAVARKNLQLLTKAAGNGNTEVTSQQRFEAPRLGKPFVDDAASATKKPSVILAQGQEAREDKEANALRELLRDLPYVMVERRAGRLTLTGWTSGPKERFLLDKILGTPSALDKKAPPPVGKPPEVLDLTTDDAGDPSRMIEIDAIIFEVLQGPDKTDCGFNFLQLINLNFNYFAADSLNPTTGYTAPAGTYGNLLPPVIGPLTGAVTAPLSQWSWITSAAANYNVNIANADIQRVAVLSQPHLTALSGTPAKSLSGGEFVYRVSGLNTGDIKPYSFGTTLNVTPTLLRTPAADGRPQVHVVVEAGRSSVLSLLTGLDPNLPTPFDKISVSSQAVVSVGQTLILSGLSQRESRTIRTGVPGLMSVPVVKYAFSRNTTIEVKAALLVLLTPRDPAFWGRQNQMAINEFIEKRRAFIQARKGTEEDMQCFRERYPDWDQLPPSRFTSHLFLTEASEVYRTVAGTELTSDDIDLELLGSRRRAKRIR